MSITPLRDQERGRRARTCVNPVDIVDAVVRERDRLRTEVAVLRARLAMVDESFDASLINDHKLNLQQATVMSLLMGAAPRALSRLSIEAALPARDHTKDRQSKLVDVLICKIRKKLGAEAILTVPGLGWRINPNWRPPAALEPPHDP